jgi:hypothetical protein
MPLEQAPGIVRSLEQGFAATGRKRNIDLSRSFGEQLAQQDSAETKHLLVVLVLIRWAWLTVGARFEAEPFAAL